MARLGGCLRAAVAPGAPGRREVPGPGGPQAKNQALQWICLLSDLLGELQWTFGHTTMRTLTTRCTILFARQGFVVATGRQPGWQLSRPEPWRGTILNYLQHKLVSNLRVVP